MPAVRFCSACGYELHHPLERQRDPSHPYHRRDFQYWPNTYRNIVAVEKVDPLTVRITIERPYAPLLANMAMFPVSIVSPTAVATYGDELEHHPVGTGPFVFERWDRGERVVLRRNPHYWRPERAPELDRVVFEVIGEPGAESDPVTLGQLGVDFSNQPGTTEPEETPISASTRQWLWLGVALGAASLSALAFWVLGGRDGREIEVDEVVEADAEADAVEAAVVAEEPGSAP